jgi:Asp-tRNA(Asn)/Glu-tRNA(Gln) amidotransferase A subunit family amidase
MLSLLDILRRIDVGSLTPAAAIDQSLQAIGAGDAALGTFARIDPAARPGDQGPLRGIAVGLKDIIDTADLPTEYASPIYRGWRPRADAWIATRLKQLGATIVGKAATTAFASSDPAPTRNPRNPAHSPGGSSAGSAAAVAAGFVPLAVGTQTGGSVIRPASYCGVAAIKPSFDLLSTVGVKCYSWSLDTLGLFAAGAADLAFALAALTGRPGINLSGTPAAPRVGVVLQEFAEAPEPTAVEALRLAARAFERAGGAVRDITLPEIFGAAWKSQEIIQGFESCRSFAWEYTTQYDAMPPKLRGRLDADRKIEPPAYDEAIKIAGRARSALDTVFAEVDVLLTPSAPGPAPLGFATTGDPRFNRLWTLMGVPCVNVPVYVAGTELPLGVQVVARLGADHQALAAAHLLEQALRADPEGR